MALHVTILGPTIHQTITAEWLEVETIIGNRVIQKGHVPMIVELAPNHEIHFKATTSAKPESLQIPGGILEVTREKATIIINA